MSRPSVAVGVALLGVVTGQTFEPNYSANYTYWASRLHEDLLAQYVKSQPPTSTRLVNYSAAGTDVGVHIRFYKIDHVAAAEGKMRLKVWLRTYWQDTRLSWAPADYGLPNPHSRFSHFLPSSHERRSCPLHFLTRRRTCCRALNVRATLRRRNHDLAVHRGFLHPSRRHRYLASGHHALQRPLRVDALLRPGASDSVSRWLDLLEP